jgi:transcriptional regulator with XRE-family HTH domain
MAPPDAHWVNSYDGMPLGQILADERFAFGMLQRTVAADSGVDAANLSAYECCRVTPRWDVFVRILAAMGRKPVISTEPLDQSLVTIRSVDAAIDEVLRFIAGRPYRLEDEAAAYVLGRIERIATLDVIIEDDPTRLDELAEGAIGRFRPVYTQRGGGVAPQLSYSLFGGTAVLTVVRQLPRTIEVAFNGLMVHVAPLEEIRLPAA